MVRYEEGHFPVAERFARNAITMPVWARDEDEALLVQYLDAFEKVVSDTK